MVPGIQQLVVSVSEPAIPPRELHDEVSKAVSRGQVSPELPGILPGKMSRVGFGVFWEENKVPEKSAYILLYVIFGLKPKSSLCDRLSHTVLAGRAIFLTTLGANLFISLLTSWSCQLGDEPAHLFCF